MEIKVLTEKGSKIIIGDADTLEEIKNELAGNKPFVSEYKTKGGSIITDLDIISLLSVKEGF